MFKINSIDLENFKSYYGPNKIELNAKFNVITGPAGSGKSNIIDAISCFVNERQNDSLDDLFYKREGVKSSFAKASILFGRSYVEYFKWDLEISTTKPLQITDTNGLDKIRESIFFITFLDIKKVLALKSYEVLEMVKQKTEIETNKYKKEQEEMLKYIKKEEDKLKKLRAQMIDKIFLKPEQLQREVLSTEADNNQGEIGLSLQKQLMNVSQQLCNAKTKKNKSLIQLESCVNEYNTRKNNQAINSAAFLNGPPSNDSFFTELTNLLKPKEQISSRQEKLIKNVESKISDYINMTQNLEYQRYELNLIRQRLQCIQEKELENLEKDINKLKKEINLYEEIEKRLEENVKSLEDKAGDLQEIRNKKKRYEDEDDNNTEVRDVIEFTEERLRSLLKTISDLEMLKDECLSEVYKKISLNFGSIFSIMLPGAKAKLVPSKEKIILDGLEIKVYLNGVWKESLAELNGSQRRLAAFSLILAVSSYKPAGIYILDDVDEYVDFVYAKKFHHVINTHFAKSQFIVVSQLDGMFNDANALFKTEIDKDGVTKITQIKNEYHCKEDCRLKKKKVVKYVSNKFLE